MSKIFANHSDDSDSGTDTDTVTSELPGKKPYPQVTDFDRLCVKFKGLGGIRLARFNPGVEGLPEIENTSDSIVYAMLKDVFIIAGLPTYAIDISRRKDFEGWKRMLKFRQKMPDFVLGLPVDLVVEFIQNHPQIKNKDLICKALKGGEFSPLSASDAEEIEKRGSELEKIRRLEGSKAKEEKRSAAKKRKAEKIAKKTGSEKSNERNPKKIKHAEGGNEDLRSTLFLLSSKLWPRYSKEDQNKILSLLSNTSQKYMSNLTLN